MKWTEDELAIVLQYERTNKSCYTLFNEINNTGYKKHNGFIHIYND